ncbi:hypothetical protein BDN67DRAFT_985547 [Paxillus ammoniavirescens]|nr:hypothetical protein BDN67DRAFT_985547 [Paxillus ammoniavirescens]
MPLIHPGLLAKFNGLAHEYVEEAIRERRFCGLFVPDGSFQGDGPITLWEDLGSWRSALRKKAHVYVGQRYHWDPENHHEENVNIGKGLLERGQFLKNRVDDEGHTNNLAHPALSGLIIDFFYTTSLSVGKLFPEVFWEEVPRIKVVLDEMVAGQNEIAEGEVGYIQSVMSNCLRSNDVSSLTDRNGAMDPEVILTTAGFDVNLD